MRFTQGYANSPVCSPTRFALMTGRYQYRLRGAAEEPIGSAHARRHGARPAARASDAAVAARRTPATARRSSASGTSASRRPSARCASGYEEFFGPMSGGVDYFTHRDAAARTTCSERRRGASRDGYLTDLISRPRGRLRRRAAGRDEAPFFLSLHYTAPHWPWETRDDGELAQDVRQGTTDLHLDGGNIHTYRRMIHHMDEGIGWVSAALDDNGVARRHARRLHQRQRRRALLRQLAAGRRQDGPDRGRHPRALDRALAGAHRRPGGRPSSSP